MRASLHSYWTLWTTELIQCLENQVAWPTPLVTELPSTTSQDEIGDRRQILLDEAFLSLPKPMQTLLQALRHIKLKIREHECTFISNSEALYASLAIRHAKKICEILELAKQLRNGPLQERLDTMAKDFYLTMPGLAVDVSTASTTASTTESTTASAPSFQELKSSLDSKASNLRLSLFESVESSRAYGKKTLALTEAVNQSSEAVEASEKFRQRLLDLAQGPLSKLFEVSLDNPKANETEDTLEMIRESPSMEKKLLIEAQIHENKTLQVKLRYLADRIIREASDETLKINRDAIESIKKIVLSAPETLVYKTPKELSQADSSVQKEIALVLGTLTMDRGSIDTILRSIKSECFVLKSASEEESRASLFKTLKELQALYTSAAENFLH